MKTTEAESNYTDLEKMTVRKLLINMNQEDHTLPIAINKAIPKIENLIKQIVKKMKDGGRLFYIGAGTSGRLGILDASECPPTYGIKKNIVIGLIAGGDQAIRNAIEFAEDDLNQGWEDLKKMKVSHLDVVIGITASGSTPYVLGALKKCKKKNIVTGSIACNINSEVSKIAQFPIEIIVGPEFVTGSTRMKCGTAQKLVLNMISTSVMIKLGKVKGNKMIDMKLSNHKLIDRGTKMVMKNIGIKNYDEAKFLLLKHGSVRKVEDVLKR